MGYKPTGKLPARQASGQGSAKRTIRIRSIDTTKSIWEPGNIDAFVEVEIPEDEVRLTSKATSKATRQPHATSKATRQPQREFARRAITAIFPDGVADPATIPNALLLKKVSAWIKDNCAGREMKDDTILRAAGRRK